MDDFLKEIQADFLNESEDLLEEMEGILLELEKGSTEDHFPHLFRLAHNLKGSAQAVELSGFADLCHHLESYLTRLQEGEGHLKSEELALLFEGADHLRKFHNLLLDNPEGEYPYKDFLSKLTGDTGSEAQVSEEQSSIENETEDVPENDTEEEDIEKKIAEMMVPGETGSEELLGDKGDEESQENSTDEKESPSPIEVTNTSDEKSSSPSPSPSKSGKAPSKEEFLKIPLSKVDQILNLFGEQVVLQSIIDSQIEDTGQETRDHLNQLGKITNDLQSKMMGLRMVALKPLYQRLERTIRDVKNEVGKDLNFVKEGETNELDKSIVDQLADPLVHMVRNSCDHGIEEKETRLEKGKPEKGTIFLRSYKKGGHFYFEIEDDGGGLDEEMIFEKAVSKGIISHNESLSKDEILHLIFHSGFSTKEKATEISGRGVGMDVVRSTIEGLKGKIEIQSSAGEGTKFKIRLPLTTAVFNGLVVCVGEDRYIIPNSDVLQLIELEKTESLKKGLDGPIVRVRDEVLPLVNLKEKFSTRNSEGAKVLLVTEHDDQKIVFAVDDVLGQKRVVHKSLGEEMKGLEEISGASIFEDGSVGLILDLSKFIGEKRRAS